MGNESFFISITGVHPGLATPNIPTTTSTTTTTTTTTTHVCYVHNNEGQVNPDGSPRDTCVIPYQAFGIWFNGCTKWLVDPGQAWCATAVNETGTTAWDYCIDIDCKKYIAPISK